jgi:GNAT superfamily N-acetyltransferase
MAELEYRMATLEYAEEMLALEYLCFPTIDRDDLISIAEIEMQFAVFPEGGFMVLDGERVVGIASGVFVDYDISEPQHSMGDVIGETGADKHDPSGDWYYGKDIAVHPDLRGMGIGRRLYELRKQVVKDHGKRGIIAGGVIPGFADHKHEMTAAEYVKAVAAGDLFDPTLSMQIANGFEARGVISNYVDDETTDGWASFIVWFNPDVPGPEADA